MFVVPILNIPLGSAVCLLVAGILIGHLIWFRDRSDDDATLHGLRAENDELQSALHEHKQAYVALESDLDDRLKEWNQLKSANKQLEKAHNASDHDIAELNNEIARLQQLKDQAFHDLDQERQKRRSLQEALTQAEDNASRVGNLTNQLKAEVSAFQDGQKQIDELATARLAEKEAEFEKLRHELEAIQLERDELHSRIEAQSGEVESGSQIAQQYERAQQALQAAKRENDSLQKERDEVTAALEAARQEVDIVKQLQLQQVEEAETLQTQLQSMTAELESVTASFETAKANLEATESEQLEAATQEVFATQEKLQSLTAEYETAQVQLETLQREHATLQQTTEAMTGQQSNAAQEFAELQQSYELIQATVRSLQEDLRSIREERDELIQQVDDERVSREKTEGKVRHVDQLVSQRDQAIDRASKLEEEMVELREVLAKLQDQEFAGVEAVNLQLEELRTQNASLQESLEKLTQEHTTVSTMLTDERSRSSKMEADNHRLSVVVSEASQRADSIQDDLKSRDDKHTAELTYLRSELEETAALLSRERHQREHLQGVLDSKKAVEETLVRETQKHQVAFAELQQQNTVLQQHAEEFLALQGEHASVKRMLQAAADQLTSLRTSSVSMVSGQQKLQQQVDQLQSKNEEYAQRVTQLSSEKVSLSNRIDQLEDSNSTASTSRERLDLALENLNEENRTLQHKLAEFEDAKAAFLEQEERLAKVIAQRDEAIGSQAEQLEVVKELREQIQTQSRSLSSLHQKNDQLQQVAANYDELQREHLQLQSHLSDSADRLQSLTAEQQEKYAHEQSLRDSIAHLESRAKANEETIRNLRRERAAVMRTRQPSPSVPFRSRSVMEEESGGRMRRDDVLGMVYTQPPKYKDDLKRISGIAHVLEKKLNAFGVYTYRQVMEWDVVAVAEFSKLLSFRDRIERDDWMGQARSLFYEKYGRAA